MLTYHMSETINTAIRIALRSRDSIPRELVREWIGSSPDIETLALLYQLTSQAWSRITPELERDETCAFIRDYFLQCILEDPGDGLALSRYEAAGELELWFDYLSDQPSTENILKGVAKAVTELFLSSNDAVQRAIETGFLEHILEQEKLRHYFSHWGDNERLRESWQCALAWGEAHPDHMKDLRQQLRNLQHRG